MQVFEIVALGLLGAIGVVSALPGCHDALAAVSAHVAAVCALIACLHRRRRVAAIALVGMVAACLPWMAASAEPRAARLASAATEPLRVAHANVRTDNPQRISAIDAALAHGRDLVCLAEVHRDDERDLRANQRWPHQVWDVSNVGIALLSRHPIVASEAHTTTLPPFIVATVHTPIGEVTVIACHLASPRTAESARMADRAARAIAAIARESRAPVLLLGDLNVPLASSRWRSFRAAADLHRPAGREPATWPALAGEAGVGIDRILTRGLAMEPTRSFALPGSDHRGIATLVGAVDATARDLP